MIIFFFGISAILLRGIISSEYLYNIESFKLSISRLQALSIILSIIAFIIHILAFIEANNNGAYNIGNILGVVASALIIFKLGTLKIFPIGVYFIAALFSLIQKRAYL